MRKHAVLGSLGVIAAGLVMGCTSFSANDASADAGNVSEAGNDAGNDGPRPNDGQPSGAPDAPSGIAPAAVPVVTTVTTLAGSGTPGFADGAGAAASFKDPAGIAVDATGNVYVADTGNSRIRKVTPTGVVTTLAGSGTATYANGSGASASFAVPEGVAVDATGIVYVADTDNGCIRKVTPGGVVTTLAGVAPNGGGYVDGPGQLAQFSVPAGITVDDAGNVYVADRGNLLVRKVTPAGVTTTIAGAIEGGFADGVGTAALFSDPRGIAMDRAKNVVLADSINHRIRRVTPAGAATTVAGSGANSFKDGAASVAGFVAPTGVTVDSVGTIYVADGNRIRRVTPASVTTLAGSGMGGFADGVGTTARFNGGLMAVAVDTTGNVYVADSANQRIRKLVSVGIGELTVTWKPPSSTGTSVITSYAASASAAGQPTKTCSTSGATSCTISGMTSGVAYRVSVTAANSAGSSAPSAPVSASPN